MTQNKIIGIEKISEYAKYLGSKTLNLKNCVDWGFNVPKFIATPSYISKNLLSSDILKKEIAKEAINILHSKKYVVRSSALIEDGKNKSFAGQFTTKINLSGDDLVRGMSDVLEQANDFLKGELDNFSMIIQEYIDPDISGVTFTRNPNSGREMVIEYGFCKGEEIVSGKIIPEKFSLYWNEPNIKLPKKLLAEQIVEKFKNIENKNKSPQDIEWCIKGNQFYLLQTRPITTISKQQYNQIIFLEKQLPKSKKYYFEKTEISEIAPRPTDFTLSLLKLIYPQNGPIKNVYKKYGVYFTETDFLKIIGNQLFIDKEEEIKGLLPAYSYLQNNKFIPKLGRYLKIFPTIKNIFFLNKIKTSNHNQIFHNLKIQIEQSIPEQNFQKTLDIFLTNYELVFEANLLSGLAIKKLNLLLKNESVQLPNILNESELFIDLNQYRIAQPKNLKGNSLEVSDESFFATIKEREGQPVEEVAKWWKKTSSFKKKILQDKIMEAIIYNRLRELGRWLTIKNITEIRTLLLDYAKNKRFNDPRNIYFASINEVLSNQIDEVICIKRKNIYNQSNQYFLPSSITSSFTQKKEKILGISAGLAKGILQNRNYLDSQKSKSEKIILYTEILSPDLTKYFDNISGIVSEKGGLLSHLAIIARERNIPVIAGFSLSDSVLRLGDSIQINGNDGSIKKTQ